MAFIHFDLNVLLGIIRQMNKFIRATYTICWASLTVINGHKFVANYPELTGANIMKAQCMFARSCREQHLLLAV